MTEHLKKSSLSRRDALKLFTLLSTSVALPSVSPLKFQPAPDSPNILIVLFDTFSARHMALHGYARQTTPNLSRLADKAIVYHNHYAGGHSTYPGTSTLLTGVHPWTHRGYRLGMKLLKAHDQNNMFGLFNTHHRIAYTHNPLAEVLLGQMDSTLDMHKARQQLYLNSQFWLDALFEKDYDTASVSWVRSIKMFDDGYANSLFLGRLYELIQNQKQRQYLAEYPLGVPVIEEDNYFLLEDAIDWIYETSASAPEPFLGYYHLLPPHGPYHTHADFHDTFLDDDFKAPKKPEHIFTEGKTEKKLLNSRKAYDEFILFVDAEFDRLYQRLQADGLLENTWLVLTSDHGEMFERGIQGHSQPTFHQPLVNIPLMVFPPGQKTRQDVFTPTSAVDVLPTLLHLADSPVPEWLEGEILPPFNAHRDPASPVFSMDAYYNDQLGPLTTASVMMRVENYKLTYHFGSKNKYKALDGSSLVELYDLDNDPEELSNLIQEQPKITKTMLDQIIRKLEEKGAL